MLELLELKNFTAFRDAKLRFASELNVIAGENGSGKTHILKLAYSVVKVIADSFSAPAQPRPSQKELEVLLAMKLRSVFRPEELGRLVSRDRRGRQRCKVSCQFSNNQELSFSFAAAAKDLEVTIEEMPSLWVDGAPVYFPTRELLTIYPGFVPLYETTHLPFEETWRDTCVLLGAPLAKEGSVRQAKVKESLEKVMGGQVILDKSGRFSLNVDNTPMEMDLVAEGFRKLGMIARLIATGSLWNGSYLFWDEPESNLNPKVIKLVARTILDLCMGQVHVFLASHSLFLLRELDILLQTDAAFKKVKSRFIGLHRKVHDIEIMQGATIDDIGEIDALQEELDQSDRYLNAGAH